MTHWKPLLLSACLFAHASLAQPPVAASALPTLKVQADAAYDAKNFAESARLFDLAIAAGAAGADTLYDASGAHALAGHRERALDLLEAAVKAGLQGKYPLDLNRDLAPLIADPRWSGIVAGFEKNNPAVPLMTVMMDKERQSAAQYFTVRRAFASGFVAPPIESSAFLQYYSTLATFVGQYDEAERLYLTMPPGDPLGTGYTIAMAANAAILARVGDRRAVFLNESHARAQTRAANFTLLASLRKRGFNILALEALGATRAPPGSAECADTVPIDLGLGSRGYPLRKSATGAYTDEPVYAQTLREALRLGYRIVGYDTDSPKGAEGREEGAARNLACLMSNDPNAKVLLVAGFGHISEKPGGGGLKGGTMAYRFKTITGIDPLTIDGTTLGRLDVSSLALDKIATGSAAEAWVLSNEKGDLYGDAARGYDISLYIRPTSHRNDGEPSWLELGGARKRFRVAASRCRGHLPCLAEAHPANESDDGVPADRCVIDKDSPRGCTLFLPPGRHRITYFDDSQALLGQLETTVR
jgi:hypothetical protein